MDEGLTEPYKTSSKTKQPCSHIFILFLFAIEYILQFYLQYLVSNCMKITKNAILKYFPIKKPYRFIDKIISVDENHIVGTYQFKEDEYFYEGHFPGNPITPGAILLEAAAQVGLLAYGMYLLAMDPANEITAEKIALLSEKPIDLNSKDANFFYLVSSDVHFRKVIRPGDKIIIRSDKVFFRFGKLKCQIRIELSNKELVCKGIISGIMSSMLNNQQI